MPNEFIGLDDNQEVVTHGNGDATTEARADMASDPIGYGGTSENENRVPTPSHQIRVHVTDDKAPIVMLFGAPSSGKTMTLVRLAKYLRQKYRLSIDMNFCNNAWEYPVNASMFNSMVGTTTALEGTDRNDFLFIKIQDSKGRTICQILEGAGEDYFPSKGVDGINRANMPFPAYMATVFAGNNKKIWCFLTEPNWKVNYEDKAEYVERIRFCKQQYTGENDKFIILYNKVDTQPFCINKTTVHKENAIMACKQEYEGIFEIFRNYSPLPFQRDYLCEFVPFSTGTYGLPVPGQLATYTPSNDKHPALLWETILKCIKN